MLKSEVDKVLNDFRKYVIQQSRTNLTKGDKNVTKSLYNSLKSQSKVMPNSIAIYFEMDEHGYYQDQGVKGKTSSQKAPNSPFRFGSGTGRKGGLTEGIRAWVRARRIQFKDVKGKFTSYESTAFMITRSIWHKGMKPSLFFTKPFEKAFKNLPDELVEAYGLDTEKMLDTILKRK
jgi:hypothetical protein